MTIGTCDNCNRPHVPVINFKDTYCGDTTQCFLCQGDTDPDPFGELEDEALMQIDHSVSREGAGRMFASI